jgi:hypothetical protein
MLADSWQSAWIVESWNCGIVQSEKDIWRAFAMRATDVMLIHLLQYPL